MWLTTAREAGGNYSVTVSCPACASGKHAQQQIHDVTFGDVWYLSGQSNAWLPLWFTFMRNVTDAGLRAGNYSNVRLWRGGSDDGLPDEGNWIEPAGPGVRDCRGVGFANDQWCLPLDLLASNIRDGEPWLWEAPALGAYFAFYLTDMMLSAGQTPPPIGIMSNPIGGTQVEEWTRWETQVTACKNVSCMCSKSGCNIYQPLDRGACKKNALVYQGNVEPMVNTTLKGFLWLQGENNAGTDAGNWLDGTGYGCLISAMLKQWRDIWSVVPGTTDALAPFGFVELADSTDEGWAVNFARLHSSQTCNFGQANTVALPNSFMAHTHDAGDPWSYDCQDNMCCVDAYEPLGKKCQGDHRGEWSANATGFFMGPIHPRTKHIHAQRLAQAAFSSVYGGSVIGVGPVLAGCALSGNSLVVAFNTTLLAGESVTASDSASIALENTAMYVLVGASLPADAGAGHHPLSQDYSPYANGAEWGVRGWVPVAATSGPAPHQVTVDLSHLPAGSVPTALRYASGTGGYGSPGGHDNRMCCGPSLDTALAPCPPASCPIKATGPNTLPAAPFVAAIQNGRCTCLPPQVCDGA